MLDFHKYLMRYGEFGVQAIIERIERNEGIRFSAQATLEDRWTALMRESSLQSPPLAA